MFAMTDNLRLMANYAYVDTEIMSGPLNGQTLAYAPEDTFSLGANFEHRFGRQS